MISHIIRRLFYSVIVLVLVSLLIFTILRLMPGDPLMIYVARNELPILTEEQHRELMHEFGLDRSKPMQYLNWLSGVLRGDFGKSITYGQDVGKLIAERLPITIHLAVLSIAITSLFGILTGIFSAIRRGTSLDAVLTFAANFGISVPIFWLGILMIYLFGVYLGWLPIQGYTSPFTDLWLNSKKLVMPVICMSVVSMASATRLTRSSVLEVVQQDYVRTARSKGLRERVVMSRHVLRNSLIPVVTVIGAQFSHVIGGSVLVETVFNIPGMGRLIASSVIAQDYAVVQGCIVIFAVFVVLINLLVDISYAWIDPRIRYS